MPSAVTLYKAWWDAANYASDIAGGLNDAARHGNRTAQAEWVAEFERCSAQAEAVELVMIDDDIAEEAEKLREGHAAVSTHWRKYASEA